MPVYEWTGVDEFRVGATDDYVAPGETVELPEHVGGPQPEMRRVADGPGEDSGGEPPGADSDTPDPPFDPGGLSVDELRDQLSEGEFGPDALDALEAAELAGDARSTALDAIDAARE
ncbi:hypothetical protein [Haloarcula pelagica]|uniref:hypothetical protein n=1 Tax=Haloarcula pelagica TaxID=3033389 RepID=UPI0024C397FF|nr:hypothetical protein [Halomicroarcula sp. YJ-61-S]